MKYLLIALIFSSISYGADCSTTKAESSVQEQLEIKTDVPNFLKGAKIVVRRADGQESEVPAEAFKVVPRKQQFIVTKVKETEQTTCQAPAAETAPEQKNRVSLLGGGGPRNNLDTAKSGVVTEVSTETGFVGGVQYQRKIGKRFSVGGQVQTNESGSVLLGLDF